MTVATRVHQCSGARERTEPSSVLGADGVVLGADGLVRRATRCLERGRWAQADAAARQALDVEPDNAGAWSCLAAAFAGTGWLDEADWCWTQAREQDPAADEAVMGRAVNRWALERTPVAVAAVVGLAIGLGVLAFAVALTVPFLTREVRIRRLPATWRARAEAAWPGQGGLRYPAAVTVLLLVALWASAGPSAG